MLVILLLFLLISCCGSDVVVDDLKLSNCHEYINYPTALMNCIHRFNGENESLHSNNRKKIAIISKYSNNILDYAAYSQYLLLSYINHHNNVLIEDPDSISNLYEYVYLPYHNYSSDENIAVSKNPVYRFISDFYNTTGIIDGITSTTDSNSMMYDYSRYPKLRYLLHAASMRTKAGTRTFDYLLWIDAGMAPICFYLFIFVYICLYLYTDM